MTVKELFDKAENGTLTWEQFQAAMGDAKFVDLNEGKYVSKQKYDDELSQRDTRITSLNDTISSRDTDLTNLKKILEDAGDIEALKTASTNLANLQKKYDKETKEFQAQLAKQSYEFAVREFANTKKFTSNAAKRDFVHAMIEKNLQMEDNKIIGADDFVTMYSTDNEDAFVKENQPGPQEQQKQPLPTFVNPTQGEKVSPQDQGSNAFLQAFKFTGVRPVEKK